MCVCVFTSEETITTTKLSISLRARLYFCKFSQFPSVIILLYLLWPTKKQVIYWVSDRVNGLNSICTLTYGIGHWVNQCTGIDGGEI